MEMKSNDGPTVGLAAALALGSVSAGVGRAARNRSCVVLLFRRSSLMDIAGGDGAFVFGELRFVVEMGAVVTAVAAVGGDAVCRRLRLPDGRLYASDGRSSMSPRMTVDDWRSRSSMSRPSCGLDDCAG